MDKSEKQPCKLLWNSVRIKRQLLKSYFTGSRKQKMQIKQQTIGQGRPLICVPVVETEEEHIYKAAELAAGQGAELLEWRMDWFRELDCFQIVERILCRLQEICGDVILLCTFRSKPQGGEQDIPEDMYVELLCKIAESRKADLLDVEMPELSEPSKVIQMLHGFGQYVIGSSHYFSHTPDVDGMQRELTGMQQAGADIGKLAVMPHSPRDVLRLLEATVRMKEISPEYPLVTMAMGDLGVISRISGQFFGSCMTFASLGRTSAPGQLPLADVAGMLDKLSGSIANGVD